MKKIVLLGGSFNPIHFGHLEILKTAVKQLNADQGWFLVANQAPLKEDYSVSFKQRCHWINCMIKGFKKLKVCQIEKDLPIPNYTINTIKRLKEVYPDYQFIFLIGSDQALKLDHWYQIEKLKTMIEFVVYERDQIAVSGLRVIKGASIDVSSSSIRCGQSFLTHKQILREIMLYGYYAKERLEHLSDKRQQHIYSVAAFIHSLAPVSFNNLQIKKLIGLAIAHDTFKEDKSLNNLSKYEQIFPQYLHHACMIRNVAAKRYYVFDKQFLNSLLYHVQGQSTNLYAMLLFVADKLEPNRPFDTKKLLRLVKNNLYNGFIETRKESLKFNG